MSRPKGFKSHRWNLNWDEVSPENHLPGEVTRWTCQKCGAIKLYGNFGPRGGFCYGFWLIDGKAVGNVVYPNTQCPAPWVKNLDREPS